MENNTMTIDAMHMSRVASVCPQDGRHLLAPIGSWIKGTAVPASVVIPDGPAYAGAFGTDATDLEFRPFGEPPV